MKFFRNCPNDSCTDCRRCDRYYQCQKRLAERRARNARNARKTNTASQAVKVTYCQPARRPRNAYAYAVINTWMNKINLEKVIAVIATVLVVAFLLEPVGHLVRMFVLDMEFALAKDSAPAVSEPFVPELDKNLTQVSLQGVVGVAEEIEEAQEETQAKYPDATPEEVYSPTHLGARPYYIYFLTHEEKVMMAKVVYREARGECERGRVAVAAVIINRYLNGGFGGSISEVVRQTNAFANISYVTDDMLEANPQCMEAVALACKGWHPTREWFEDTGALFFYNPNGDLSPEARAAREGVEQYSIGNHNFHVELN